MKAKEILEAVKALHKDTTYGRVPKEWVIDYIMSKNRREKERIDRHKADISVAENLSALKTQVANLENVNSTLREMADSAAREARTSKTIAIVSIVVASVSALLSALLPSLLG